LWRLVGSLGRTGERKKRRKKSQSRRTGSHSGYRRRKTEVVVTWETTNRIENRLEGSSPNGLKGELQEGRRKSKEGLYC